MKLKEDIKRTAKTISLQELNESEIGQQIEYEIERLIKAKRTNKKIDYDKIKKAITLELKQLKKRWFKLKYYDDYQDLYNSEENWYYTYVDEQLKRIRRRYNESKEINSRNR